MNRNAGETGRVGGRISSERINSKHHMESCQARPVRAWRNILRRLKNHLVGTVTHVITDDSVAALTFDDGPHIDYTPILLDILKRYEAVATFFMVGQSALEYPELVRRVYEGGHVIGNHTFSHVSLPSLSMRARIGEIWACQRALYPFGSRLLRTPWGEQSNMSRLNASMLGYKVIAWNVVAEDWGDHSAQWMAESLAAALRPGCIILLHDRIFKSIMKEPQYDRTALLEAVRLFLDGVKGRFRFVTIPQLLKQGRPHFAVWKRLPLQDEMMQR